jgi:hypothetical protein
VGQDITNARPLGFEEFAIALRKAAEVYGERFFIVVGRGSLSATMPDVAARLRTTGDIDLFAPFKPECLDLWSAADSLVSVESEFFIKHGFYIERVGEWTLLSQPVGWQQRGHSLRIDDIDVLVLHPLDPRLQQTGSRAGEGHRIHGRGIALRSLPRARSEKIIESGAPDEQTKNLVSEAFERALKLSQLSTKN